MKDDSDHEVFCSCTPARAIYSKAMPDVVCGIKPQSIALHRRLADRSHIACTQKPFEDAAIDLHAEAAADAPLSASATDFIVAIAMELYIILFPLPSFVFLPVCRCRVWERTVPFTFNDRHKQ